MRNFVNVLSALTIVIFLLCSGDLRADAIVGGHLVRQAKLQELNGDRPGAIKTLERAIEYRDTVKRRLAIATLLEKEGNLGATIFHLKRAHEMTPTRQIVSWLVKVQRDFREREDARLEALEEQREEELAKKQAEERRKRLAAIKKAREERAANIPKLNLPTPTPGAPPPTKAPTTAVGVAVTGNLQAFVDGLSSISAFARRKSALAIAEAGRTDLAPRISALLKDDDPFVRMDAADALRTLRSPETVVPLLERLFAEKTYSVQSRLVDAVEAEGSRTALNGLAQYRDYISSGSRIYSHVMAAIERLERIHDPE